MLVFYLKTLLSIIIKFSFASTNISGPVLHKEKIIENKFFPKTSNEQMTSNEVIANHLSQEKVNAATFGVKGDGQSDDFNSLQRAINSAASKGTSLFLEKDAIYRFTKPLDIKCSIEGNGSQLLPDFGNTRAMTFSGSNLRVTNLKIGSDKMLFINVNGDNIEFKNCSVEGESYFGLVILNGDNCSFKESSIVNNFKGRQQFAIRSSSDINNFNIEDSYIYGGIYLPNSSHKKIGNYSFINNEIKIDYSHVNQEMNIQHDGFYFRGIDGIKLYDNEIYFKNVNRGFKFTDVEKNNKTQLVSDFPTTNVDIRNNKIYANSKNGKQLFDFYDGTAIVNIQQNTINSVGHTIIFEDKTASKLSTERLFTLESNEIHFDFEILYYRGNYNTAQSSKSVGLNINNNKFIFTPGKVTNKINRIITKGNSVDVKLQYPFYIRSINSFSFVNNTMLSNNKTMPFKNKYTLYIYDTHKSIVRGNTLNGGVLYNGDTTNSLTFSENIVENIGLPNLIKTVSHKFNEYTNFNITDNTINYSGKTFDLPLNDHSSQRIRNNKSSRIRN